jgi:DNA modification methylase
MKIKFKKLHPAAVMPKRATDGAAAKRLNRKCTLIEKEEKYCEIAARRLSQGVLPLWEKEEN